MIRGIAAMGETVQQGVRICPSYILYERGEAVYRGAFPTTGDLLAGVVHDAVRRRSEATE